MDDDAERLERAIALARERAEQKGHLPGFFAHGRSQCQREGCRATALLDGREVVGAMVRVVCPSWRPWLVPSVAGSMVEERTRGGSWHSG